MGYLVIHRRASPERLVGTRRLGQYMQGNEVWWSLYSIRLTFDCEDKTYIYREVSTLITLIQFKFNSPIYRVVACFPFIAMGRGRSFGIMQGCCKEGCCNQSPFSCARSPEAWVMGCWEWKHGTWYIEEQQSGSCKERREKKGFLKWLS